MDEISTFILIVSYNERENLQECIESIRNFTALDNLNIVVIDNASNDGTCEWLKTQSDIAYAVETEYCENWGKLINEAIRQFGIEGDIIFMQPKHRNTPFCIEQTKEALYLQNDIGAVGPLINGNNFSCHELTQKDENGKAKIKQVIRLKEDAVMLRHDVIKAVGEMDESFYLYDYAISDYMLRTVKLGFKLYCVTSTVIISVNQQEDIKELSQKTDADAKALRSKWGMNYFIAEPNQELINLITQEKNAEISVLEIGCDCGATLLELKNTYPNAKTYGYEINPNSVDISSMVAEVEAGNVEEKNFPYEKNMFDYIFFGDVLEHLYRPDETVAYCRKFLKEDGCIIACIPNLMHISVVKSLLEGYFTYQEIGLLDRTHIHMFTLYEILDMFNKNGFEIDRIDIKKSEISEEEEEYIDKILSITAHGDRRLFEVFQYVIRAKKVKRKEA